MDILLDIWNGIKAVFGWAIQIIIGILSWLINIIIALFK